jgi:hypothetical protein
MVELGQRIGHAEVVVVVGQQLLAGLERVLRPARLARSDDDPELGAAGLGRHPLELAGHQRQQVARTSRGVGAKASRVPPSGRASRRSTGMLE